MKDYEVNYVHQESKTIPDANYTFETSTKPAPCKCSDFIKTQTPPTYKDVLLKRYQDSDWSFASSRVQGKEVNGRTKFYRAGVDRGYDTISEAIDAEIAYLNSAAEVGK